MNFKPLSEFIDYITKVKVPGADAMVVYKNEPVFRYTAGFSDLETKAEMKKGMLYNMYSATKPVTCVAALKLFEQGKFSLDDEVSKFLPEFSEMYVADGSVLKKAKNKITIRQLFTMTSGIAFNVKTPHILSAKKEGRITTREIVAEIAKDSLVFEPGTKWKYGLSHDVLGALIEEISGASLGEYLKKNIFEPLGMQNTSFHLNDEMEKIWRLSIFIMMKQGNAKRFQIKTILN